MIDSSENTGTCDNKGQKMRKSIKYDFNALLVVPSDDKIMDSMYDMTDAALRVSPACPAWRGRPLPDQNRLMIDWLYNERPDIARTIERRHGLYPETDGADPLFWRK